jgi:hypothetical protein
MILWTVRAQRHLQQALAELTCLQGSPAFEAKMHDLERILAQTFPQTTVVVHDQYVSYRRSDEKLVLLVEVHDPAYQRTAVVKIAPPERLRREIAGWQSCCPIGLGHDLVFMTLEEHRDQAQPGSPLVSLVYSDAQQLLGVDRTITLEAALLDAVRYGNPTLSSVDFVLTQLFERLGLLLYARSFVDDPAREDYVFDLPGLHGKLKLWEEDDPPRNTRQDVNTAALTQTGAFRDPVEFLRYVEAFVPWELAPAVAPGEPRPSKVQRPTPSPGPADRTPADLLPRLLRGCAHGDLHGRNVLVGIIRNRALWPAVFDYEDMSPRNLPGWDFVKLETELKARAYPGLFAGLSIQGYIEAVQHFEMELNEQTEACHRSWKWSALRDDEPTPADRLRAVLLAIRHQAARHLGEDRGRAGEWLHEYYFLLACYGVSVSSFQNLLPLERAGAYLSAGVATARYLWYRQEQWERAVARA